MMLATLMVCAASAVGAAEVGSVLPPPRHGRTYVIAHRGVHDTIPENTVPAFLRAIELGADFVEVDIRTTKDGKLVCSHNSTIEGYVQGAKGRIRDMTFDELRALDFGARMGAQWAGTKIPLFEEVLDACKDKIGIYLDVKDADLETLVGMLKARGMEKKCVWYISGPATLRLRKLCPDCIGMPDPYSFKGLPKLLATANPRVVAVGWEGFSKEFADTCHAANAIVFVDDNGPDTWATAMEWGVDGIQTDRPADLITFLDSGKK